MASEILIRQAEKMYKSMADTTDYAKLLTQPAVDAMTESLKLARAKTEALIATMPAGVNISKVPEDLRGKVTDYLTENKAAYVEASKVIASGIKPTDQRYIDAIETMNRVRGGFQALDANLTKLAENRKLSLDTRDNISPYATDPQQILHEKFASGAIYDELTLEDGNFYYVSGDDKINTNDYRVGAQQSGVITDNMQGIHDHAIGQKYKGNQFDEKRYRGIIRNNLKKAGKDGRGDFAYSGLYGDESGTTEFIDKWIEEAHGITDRESGEYKRLYQSLKNQDFSSKTEIGRSLEDYLVNTVRTSYDNAKTASRGGGGGGGGGGARGRDTLPVGYGVGYITTASANNFHRSIQNKDEVIQSPNGKYFKFVDGQYWSMNDKNEAGPKAEGSNLASNQFLLMDAGIWNQGYKLDNYTGTGVVTEGDDVPTFDPKFKGKKTKFTDFEKQQEEMMEVMNMDISEEEKTKKLKEIQKKYK